MSAVRAATFAIGLAVLAALSACSREQRDWRSAQAADTIEAYGSFLQSHPDGAHAPDARTRVEQLAEDRDWERAGAANTRDAYRQFLVQHPNGKWSEEARIRVENFDLDAAGQPVAAPAPAPAAAAAVPAESAASAVSPPSPAPAKAAPAVPASRPSGFGVQLGAFGSEDKAKATWQRLQAHFGSRLGKLMPRFEPVQTNAGRLFRLRAATQSEAEARAICAALKQQLEQCNIYLPEDPAGRIGRP